MTERRSMHNKVISLALAVEVLANKVSSLAVEIYSSHHVTLCCKVMYIK